MGPHKGNAKERHTFLVAYLCPSKISYIHRKTFILLHCNKITHVDNSQMTLRDQWFLILGNAGLLAEEIVELYKYHIMPFWES